MKKSTLRKMLLIGITSIFISVSAFYYLHPFETNWIGILFELIWGVGVLCFWWSIGFSSLTWIVELSGQENLNDEDVPNDPYSKASYRQFQMFLDLGFRFKPEDD